MYRCLVDVCPVEELDRRKSETTEVIPQKDASPEPPPPPPPPLLELAVQAEPDEEEDARAKSPSPVALSAVKSPSPVASPVVATQPETATSGPSPPAVLQVIKNTFGL